MSIVVVSVISVLVTCALAYRADASFHSEDRPPMQWWVTGEVTWSAPRHLGASPLPSCRHWQLSHLGSLRSWRSTSRPDPGKKGSCFLRQSGWARCSLRCNFYTFGSSQERCTSKSLNGVACQQTNRPIFGLFWGKAAAVQCRLSLLPHRKRTVCIPPASDIRDAIIHVGRHIGYSPPRGVMLA